MNIEKKVTAFLLKFTYAQKLTVVVFLTFLICCATSVGLWFSSTVLYRETLLDKATFNFQVSISKITNALAAYQLEVVRHNVSAENLDPKTLASIEENVNKEIEDFISNILKYSKENDSVPLQLQAQYHVENMEEFVKLWKGYRKIAFDTPLEVIQEKFLQLLRVMDRIQTNIRSSYRLYSNTDEGTKRLIDVNYVAIPRSTLQIPLFYTLLASLEPNAKISLGDFRNSDVYGVSLKINQNTALVGTILENISAQIDDSLQYDTQSLFSDLLEKMTSVSTEMIDALKNNSVKGSYNVAKRALEVYGETQTKLNAILGNLYDLQTSTMATRLYIGYGFVFFAGFFILGTYFAKIILQPIRELSDAANELAVGKVNVRLPIRFHDEVGEMSEGFNALAAFLEAKLREIKGVSKNLLEAVHVIFDVARKLESNINIQDRELSVVRGYIKEITVVAKEFSLHLTDVYKSINATAGFADLGRKSLAEMEHVMQQMMEVSQSIVSTLNALNNRICSINDVINTIVQIADQINLLSLNTAIQANKAGSEGRGFSIIAHKIKELSGQTAFSTLDIEKTVREIVTSVDFSVSEVNRFLEQVVGQVTESTELSQEFKKLIDFFQKQVEAFESVNEDMSKQAESATELQEVLRTLSNASKKTTTSVNQFCREIEHLHQSTTSLVEKIDSFTHPSYIQQLAVSEDQGAGDV